MNKNTIHLIILFLSLILGGCEQSIQRVTIGVLVNPNTIEGQTLKNSGELILKQINALGGISSLGKNYQLEVIYQDIGATPESAMKATHEILSKHNLSAIIGPNLSNQAIPVSNIVNKLKIPLISPMSTHKETTLNKDFIYRAVTIDDVQSKALAKFAGELNNNSAAVLYDISNAYSKNIADSFKAYFEANYNKLVILESYVAREQNFSEKLQKIRQLNPDILLLPNFESDINNQLKEIKIMDWQVMLLGTDSWSPQSLESFSLSNKIYFSDHWSVSVGQSNDIAKKFIQDYQHYYNSEPSVAAALAYDSFSVIIESIKNSGTTADAINAELSVLNNYQGVTGLFTFNDSGDPDKPIYIFEFINNMVTLAKEVNNE